MSDERPWPAWWRDAYHNDELLYACAHADMTATEVIAHMAHRDQERRRTIEQLVMHDAPPIVLRLDTDAAGNVMVLCADGEGR